VSRVRRILAPNPGPFTLEGTNTWVVGERPSVVIDPGPEDAGHLLAILDEAEPVAAIVLTHRHPDHAPGAARLSEVARAPVHAFRPERGETPLTDGQVIEAGSAHLRVVHTPGHTADHVAFFMDGQRFLFTGDAVLGRGTSVVDPPEGDMAEYMTSLATMRELGPRVIYPGHGPVVFDAEAKLDEYLAHRADREQQVLAALKAGRATTGQIVPGIYAKEIPESMFPVAERSVLAHLIKLEREGKVARTGRGDAARFAVVTPKACRRCGRPAAPGSSLCNRCAMAALQERP
jgi:glyoxylase-like metal-dependent hydrolase (beta-lactamase superfamily II)